MFGFKKKDKIQVVKIGGAFFIKRGDDQYLESSESMDKSWWSKDHIKYATAFGTSKEAEDRWLLISSEEIVKELS